MWKENIGGIGKAIEGEDDIPGNNICLYEIEVMRTVLYGFEIWVLVFGKVEHLRCSK